MSSKYCRIVATKLFESGVAKLKKKHEDAAIDKLYQIVKELSEFKVTKQHKNHPLKNADGHKDIHVVHGKVILIYKYLGDGESVDECALMITLRLHDVVNHTQLDNYNQKKYKAKADEYDIENIKSSHQISTNYDDFMDWLLSLPDDIQWEVDSFADEQGLPLYQDCSDEDLAWIIDYFQSKVEAATDISRPDPEGDNLYGSDMTLAQKRYDLIKVRDELEKLRRRVVKFRDKYMGQDVQTGLQAIDDQLYTSIETWDKFFDI